MPRIPIWQVITIILMITIPSLVPSGVQASIPKDKWLHFGAGVGICSGGYAMGSLISDEPWIRGVTGFTLAITAGGIKEWADYGGSGESSTADFMATLSGAVITAGIILIWDHLSTYKEKEKSPQTTLPSPLNHETAPQPDVYQKHLRTRPSYESELSKRISRHALQTRPKIPTGVSTLANNCTLHGPCRTFLQHQLFLH